MSNLEDQVTPVEDKERERDGSEAIFPRKRNWFLAQGGDGPNSKRLRIITEEEEYKCPLLQDMASYANNNSEKYIPEKDVKNTKAREAWSSQKKWMIIYMSFYNRKRGGKILLLITL